MKKGLFILNVLLLTFVIAFCAGCSDDNTTSDDSAKATAISTAGKTDDVSASPVATEKVTASPTAEPTEEPTVEPTATPTEKPVEKKIKINYINDGLFALYEGTFNTLDGFDDTIFWDDLSGNKNHIEEVPNDGERVFFDEEKGLFLDHKEVFFPDEIVEMINTNSYTVELKLSALQGDN